MRLKYGKQGVLLSSTNELNKLEVNEAERVEKLRQQNADKQRKALQNDQKKERQQLLAKIETSRNNL